MKKFLFTAAFIVSMQWANAQVSDTISTQPTVTATANKKIDLSNRANDHFMLQYGFDNWAGTPDSISPKGFSRFFNVYFMLDKPFKTNPKMSVGLGAGIGSSNMFFKDTYVDVKSLSTRMPFRNVNSANHFKKFKVTTIFVEAPIELRYSSNPLNTAKSFKGALGIKVGSLLKAYTKGKTLQDKNNTTLNNYIEKESSKKFFNSTKLAVTGRIGYGFLSLYGSYQITSVLKEAAGPSFRPYSIGLTLSGL